MNTQVVLLMILMIAGFAVLYFALKRQLQSGIQEQSLEKVVEQVFGRSANLVAEQSRQLLQGEKQVIAQNLAQQHKSVEDLIGTLRNDLDKRQAEIRLLEQDRVKKFGELSSSLDTHRKLAEQLEVSTKKLSEVLSNNQARGEWGERIIEDLMRANGLVEGVHYARQLKLGESTLRPDITLLLPNKRSVAVDVKFPFSEMQKLALSDSKAEQQTHLKLFAANLRAKVDKVAEYISPSSLTLDYAIMFVPNEMIFSYINQKLPDILDYALEKQVLMVSPFTFLIVARTVIESYRNFMISDSLREAASQIDEFVLEWGRFKDQFDKYGRTLKTLQSDYEQLTGTRVRQMEKRIDRVQSTRQGELLTAESIVEALPESL